MMLPTTRKYLIIEMVVLFVVLPTSLLIPLIPLWVKIIPVLIGFLYVLGAIYLHSGFKIQKPVQNIQWFWRVFLLRLIIIGVLGYLVVSFLYPENVFRIITEDILLWLLIFFVYSVGSVVPQEIIYRNFFFFRYQKLFSSKNFLIVTNAFFFSISHMFLQSWLVLVITFVGGLLFAITYSKTKSTFLVSLEHATYGLWLFTVGIGSVLAFPS
tara:strand:- start:618 stop:1253 length:636 start_codon:yes stop_codon:yes gene_type:complete